VRMEAALPAEAFAPGLAVTTGLGL